MDREGTEPALQGAGAGQRAALTGPLGLSGAVRTRHLGDGTDPTDAERGCRDRQRDLGSRETTREPLAGNRLGSASRASKRRASRTPRAVLRRWSNCDCLATTRPLPGDRPATPNSPLIARALPRSHDLSGLMRLFGFWRGLGVHWTTMEPRTRQLGLPG
jgi:hypothetical protein